MYNFSYYVDSSHKFYLEDTIILNFDWFSNVKSDLLGTLYLTSKHAAIRFVSFSAKFGIFTVVGLNGHSLKLKYTLSSVQVCILT